MQLFKLSLIPALLLASTAHADSQSLWTAWFNSASINEQWKFISDVQVRSADKAEFVQNVLIRPGLSYALTANTDIAAGYAYIGSYSPTVPDTTEHRLWQQLVHRHDAGHGRLQHRFRLEQRFIERASAGDIYSDRLRYFVRYTQPLSAQSDYFVAAQNEVFLNLSNKDSLNNQTFNQNRAYLGLGKKLSPTLSVELGYLNQRINGLNSDTTNHALQASFSTSF